MNTVELTAEQNAIMKYISSRMAKAAQDYKMWELEQSTILNQFASELGLDPRGNWRFKEGAFVKDEEES